MQASEDGRARTSGQHKATVGSDVLDESKENLGHLAQQGWIVAVIPDDSTRRDHCVEAFLDSKQRLTVRVRQIDLSGNGDTSHSVIRSKAIALRDIERTYHGRFVGHFQAKRNNSWDYLEQWLKDPENYAKGHDNANTDEVDTTVIPWIVPGCMFASRDELGADVWLGNLDNLSMSVDGCVSLHDILAGYRNRLVTSVAKRDENVRLVFLSTESNPNKEGNHTRVHLYRLPVQNWKCIWILPVWDQGPNSGRRFAIVRWDGKRQWYPFLRTDGTLHPQQGVMPYTTLAPALEAHPAEKCGEGVVAVSSSEMEVSNPGHSSKRPEPGSASFGPREDFGAITGYSRSLSESSTASEIEIDGKGDFESLTKATDYFDH